MIDKIENLGLRKSILFVIIVGFCILLTYQLYRMQILQNAKYEEKSEENSIKRNEINAPRGIFFDRNFNVLVSNKPSFTISVTPAFYEKKFNPHLEMMLNYDEGRINTLLSKSSRAARYRPTLISRDANFSTISWIEENRERLSGIEYNVEIKRDYNRVIKGSHIFGYTREITSEQLSGRRGTYEMGDFIGHNGLEKTYEEYLRGKKGYYFTVVDSRQKVIGKYLNGRADIKPVKGNDLVLSIDAKVQALAEELMEGKRGAIVAIEPSSGEILTFLSAPSFNLNSLAAVTTNKEWRSLLSDTTKPLFNRATMSIYSPGSTIKMLETMIAMDEGIWDPSHTVRCAGAWRFGNRDFKCTHVHGKVDMIESIEKSCNIYYYQLGVKIGLDRWHKYITKFGFGSKTGIDIPEETKGLVPDSDYYNRVYKNDWGPGMMLSLSIGQGEFSSTPVQLAQYAAILANSGQTCTPHLVKGYIDSETNEYKEFSFDTLKVDMSKEAFEVARQGMLKVVHGEGTGRWIKNRNYRIAGKTGTAQNPFGEDHAIFIAFAPYDDPKIAIAVFIENVGFGSTHAAPVAAKLIKEYLGDYKESPQGQISMR